MTGEFDAWIELNQSGRLLDRRAFEGLPEPVAPPWNLADHLRDALTESVANRAAKIDRRSASTGLQGEALGTLLDVVLEDACGLGAGWRKGPLVGAADAETLLDGTVFKPRRVLALQGQTALAVFVNSAERIGLHKGRRAFAQVVEYLRRRRVPLGLLTNGREWRLIFADPDNLAWVEWAADRWLDGDVLSRTLALLRRVLSPAALEPVSAVPGEHGPSKLLLAIRQTRQGQARLSKDLGERVRACVEILLQARRPVLEPSWNETEGKSVYDAACHFVMRLVVVLFAEARELLPVDSSIYHRAYGLRGMLEALERAGADRRRSRDSAWPRLLALFRLLHKGSAHPQLVVTAYGGDLFRAGDATGDAIQRAISVLESTTDPPDDETVYRMLVLLTRTTECIREGSTFRTVAVPVDFTELTSEYIGILYEGLLDYELHRAGSQPIVFLGLGDQPALPLDRLEAMSDKQLADLVKKAKVKRAAASEEDAEDDDAESDEPVDEEPENGEPEPAADTVAVLEELDPTDVRTEAMKRALAWAERAAVAGRLIKAPRGKAAAASPAWKAELARAAQAVIAREEIEPGKWRLMVKLPGELYLVRWGGTRKGAGTFYTRPQLTLPTVRRTLEPLLTGPDGRIRPPEDLLALKVCDPAMGSGSFLVASLRVLTEAVVRSLHEHGRIVRRTDAGMSDLVRIECDLLPDADRDQADERVEAIVRRAVVEHCLYGVDIDPLAVELARVSLWVETLDRRLPFTFLDHKLRCGDALVGTWLDRFRDYPLLAWWRTSPDEGTTKTGWKGVHHSANVWKTALSARADLAVKEQVELLTGQRNWLTAVASDDEIRAAIERVRELYRRLRRVPAAQPDKRADIWRKQVAPDPALAQVRDAFDTWCAIWFWPLDKLDLAPMPGTLLAPLDSAKEVVRALRETRHFFHWELEFPDVFTEKGAGFDAVVGNPPWETQKPSSKEFFSERDPLYRSYGKQDALGYQREFFASDAAFERKWLDYIGHFKDMGNFVRNAAEPFGDVEDENGKATVSLIARRAKETRSLHKKWAGERAKKSSLSDPEHPFRHQGSADLNSYKLFVEQSHALMKVGGQLGLLTPSGLYTDKGSFELRRLLLDRCRWRWLYGFENRNKIFDIHSSFKFAVTIAQKGGKSEALQVAFMRYDLDDWAVAAGTLQHSVERIRLFSPHSLSLIEIRDARDEDVLEKMHRHSILLGEEPPVGWGAAFGREFHATGDSKLFPRVDLWEAKGYRSHPYGRWLGDADVAVPVYQGALLNQFDFAASRFAGGSGHGVQWSALGWTEKHLAPQNLMSIRDVAVPISLTRLLFRYIANPTNQRTMLAALAPSFPAVHTVGIVKQHHGASSRALCAFLNSYAFDWQLRLRFGGSGGAGALDNAKLYESSVPQPGKPMDAALGQLVLALNCGNEIFAADWLEHRATVPQASAWRSAWAVPVHERLRLRTILDAVVVALYGLSRDDLRWILRDCDHPRERLADKAFRRTLDPKGFWRVDKTEDPELRHTVLTLVAFDALEKLIAEHGGDREAGIAALLALNGGEGWMLPETLRLADYDLGHDDRAKEHQPVASRLGPRFLDWQLTTTDSKSCQSGGKSAT